MSARKAHRARLVLVVDDEPVLLAIMERALCEAGYGIQSASNGLRALELAGWNPPDVLVTDIQMAGLHGVDLARLVTAKRPGTRVLLVSAGDPAHREVAAGIVLATLDGRAVGATCNLGEPDGSPSASGWRQSLTPPVSGVSWSRTSTLHRASRPIGRSHW